MVNSLLLQHGKRFGRNKIICHATTGFGTRICRRKYLFATKKLDTIALCYMGEQKRGISLALAYECYYLKNKESIDHVLATRAIAAQIWDCACKMLKVPYSNFDSQEAKILAGMIAAKKASLFGNLTSLLSCIITWCLWTSRYKARMEAIKYKTEQVWRKIKLWTQILALDLKVYKRLSV